MTYELTADEQAALETSLAEWSALEAAEEAGELDALDALAAQLAAEAAETESQS